MAKVTGDAPTGRLTASVKLTGEETNGDLRLAVRLLPVVFAFPVEVVPVDGAAARGDARLVGDPRVALPQQRKQGLGEREVPEVVGAELQLEPVLGDLAARRCHDTGVVDQDVDRAAFADQLVGERADRPQRGEVERPGGNLRGRVHAADAGGGLLPLGRVADRHQDLGAALREPGGDDEADAVAGAGDDGEFPGQVGNGDVDAACHGVLLGAAIG